MRNGDMLMTLFRYFVPSIPLSHPSVQSYLTLGPLILSYHLFSSSHTLASLILQYFNGRQEAWQRNLCFSPSICLTCTSSEISEDD